MSSVRMTKLEAQRPCWRALAETSALPSGVLGPEDFWALARLAFRLRSDTGRSGTICNGINNAPLNFRLIHDSVLTHFVDIGKSFVLYAEEFFIDRKST